MHSLTYQVMYYMLKKTGLKSAFSQQGEGLERHIMEHFRNESTSAPPKSYYKKYHITETKAAGSTCYKLISKKRKTGGKKIIYIHGGGYFMEAGASEWKFVGMLADKTNASIYFPEYPIAPENDCEQTIQMIYEIYSKLLRRTKPEDIVFMGTSAGGGIALSMAMYFRDKGFLQPNNIILISPSVDIRRVSKEDEEAYSYLDERDPILSLNSGNTICDWWRGKRDKKDPYVNPLYGDLTDLGNITIFSSTGDVLNLYVRKLIKKAEEQKVSIEYHEQPDMFHGWLVTPMKESVNARKRILNLIRL